MDKVDARTLEWWVITQWMLDTQSTSVTYVQNKIYLQMYNLRFCAFLTFLPPPRYKQWLCFDFVCLSVCMSVCLSAWKLKRRRGVTYLVSVAGWTSERALLLSRDTTQSWVAAGGGGRRSTWGLWMTARVQFTAVGRGQCPGVTQRCIGGRAMLIATLCTDTCGQ